MTLNRSQISVTKRSNTMVMLNAVYLKLSGCVYVFEIGDRMEGVVGRNRVDSSG